MNTDLFFFMRFFYGHEGRTILNQRVCIRCRSKM